MDSVSPEAKSKTLKTLTGTEYTVDVEGAGTGYDVFILDGSRLVSSGFLPLTATKQDLETFVRKSLDEDKVSIAGNYTGEE